MKLVDLLLNLLNVKWSNFWIIIFYLRDLAKWQENNIYKFHDHRLKIDTQIKLGKITHKLFV